VREHLTTPHRGPGLTGRAATKRTAPGSPAGAVPRDLASGALPIEAIRELLPVWRYLTRARKEKRIDLGELEYIARQHVTMLEGSYAIPLVVSDVLRDACKECRAKIVVVFKDGTEQKLEDPVTVGFAIAQRGGDGADGTDARWIARSRLALGGEGRDVEHDPATLILGIRPGEALPPEEPEPERPSVMTTQVMTKISRRKHSDHVTVCYA
jgi:hypothetical protein